MTTIINQKINAMLKKLVGRLGEQEILTDALNSHRSELIAIYGRRRIGKTYLVRTFFDKQITFSFTGLSNGKRTHQIKNFMLKLNEVTNNFEGEKQPTDWLEAFSYLKTFIKGMKETKKKKVIFIDEFPWVDSHKSGFLFAFENSIYPYPVSNGFPMASLKGPVGLSETATPMAFPLASLIS